MSTLTSSQLHVKRSSTRLHAPPGGVSSITFGPGGLGTVEAAVDESEKAASTDPAALPPRTGAYTSNNNNGNYDYAPPMNQKSGTPNGYSNYGSAATPASSYGSYGQNNNNKINNWGDQYRQQPVAIGAPPTSYGAGPPVPASRPLSSGSACSSRSWGSQPPLTSSKRDQNWERKRRQWLARKNGSAPGSSMGQSLSSGGPPGSSYGDGRMPMNPYMEDHYGAAAIYAPPSPLSKFVHQQSQKQQQGGFGGGYVDYERIGTAQSQSPAPLPMPPYTGAAYNDSYGYSSNGGSQMAPPSRSGGGGFNSYNPPASQAIGHGGRGTSSGGGGMSHLHQAETDSSYGVHYGAGSFGYGDATPASRGGTAVAGVSTSGGGGGYTGVGGNGNTANRNVSSARQPPGGHSNWSPFN